MENKICFYRNKLKRNTIFLYSMVHVEVMTVVSHKVVQLRSYRKHSEGKNLIDAEIYRCAK